jgi:hypothetical protein
MALNDQALLAEWSRQRLGEEFDEFQHRIGDPPEHICTVFEQCQLGMVVVVAAAAAWLQRQRDCGGNVGGATA